MRASFRGVNSNEDITSDGEILVLGYGNTLRRDDGVGPKVAEAVAALNLPGVCALSYHQLTPELAQSISAARAVIFVDATTNVASDAELREIQPADGGQVLAHATDPRSLLALAKQVFGRCPQAWSLGIPVDDLGFGDELSPRAKSGFNLALEQIKALATRLAGS